MMTEYDIEEEEDKLTITHEIEGEPAYEIELEPSGESTDMTIKTYGDFGVVLGELINIFEDWKERHAKGEPTGRTKLEITW